MNAKCRDRQEDDVKGSRNTKKSADESQCKSLGPPNDVIDTEKRSDQWSSIGVDVNEHREYGQQYRVVISAASLKNMNDRHTQPEESPQDDGDRTSYANMDLTLAIHGFYQPSNSRGANMNIAFLFTFVTHETRLGIRALVSSVAIAFS